MQSMFSIRTAVSQPFLFCSRPSDIISSMEPTLIPLAILGVIVGLILTVLLSRVLRRDHHKMTRAGLRKRAFELSEALIGFINDREACRPANDTVVSDHQHPHRRVTLHDEETQALYARDHLPEVADLREQFAMRGIRNGVLDRVYESPQNEGDLRTVSTALVEMSKGLR